MYSGFQAGSEPSPLVLLVEDEPLLRASMSRGLAKVCDVLLPPLEPAACIPPGLQAGLAELPGNIVCGSLKFCRAQATPGHVSGGEKCHIGAHARPGETPDRGGQRLAWCKACACRLGGRTVFLCQLQGHG